MGSLSPWHVLLLVLIVVLLFGSRRLPDAARSVGRSLRILKAETASLREDDDRRDDDRRYRDDRPRDAYPEDRYRDARDRDARDRDARDGDYRDRDYRDRDYREEPERDYRDRGARERDGYDDERAAGSRATNGATEPRAVEGPRMKPTVSGTRADSRAPDTERR